MKEKKENIYLWSVIVLAVLSALPLLWLSFYNHPSADDYMYAAETYRVWNETHSIWQVIKAAVQTSGNFMKTGRGFMSPRLCSRCSRLFLANSFMR